MNDTPEKDTAAEQRKRRAELKANGYRQILLTLDPQSLSAARYIAARMGGGLNHIIRASLLTQMQLLHLAHPFTQDTP